MKRILHMLTYTSAFIVALSSPSQAMFKTDFGSDQDTRRTTQHVQFRPDQIKNYFHEADTSQDIWGTLQRLQVEQTWGPSHYQFKNAELGEHFSPYRLSQELAPEQIILANVCYDRYLKEKDDKSLMEAAHSNHTLALRELASFIKSDDPELSRSLLCKSAAQGNARALYELSTEYENIQPDLAKALCQEAADSGDEEAQYALASAPLTGAYGTPKNLESAMSQIRQLAQRQNSEAIKALKSLESMEPEALFEMFDS